MKERLLAIVALAAILTGGALWLVGEPGWADAAWGVGAVVVLIPLTVDTARSLLHGDVGVDAIALVAIAGALILGEQLAGAIVALMMSGGAALEAWAAGRARRELRLLVERAPRIAHRHGAEGVEEVPVEKLVPGDLVVVRAGEIVPADARVEGSVAVVDQSALTGEPLPVTHPRGRGGAIAGRRTPGTSSSARRRVRHPRARTRRWYELVRTAESDRAPFTRLADRYAAVFLPFTLAVAGLAWAASGDPVRGWR